MKNCLRYVLWKVYPYHSAIRQTDTTVKNRTLSGKQLLFYYENLFFENRMQPFRYFIYLSCEKIKRKGTFTYCGHFSLLCHAICRLGLLNLAPLHPLISRMCHTILRDVVFKIRYWCLKSDMKVQTCTLVSYFRHCSIFKHE